MSDAEPPTDPADDPSAGLAASTIRRIVDDGPVGFIVSDDTDRIMAVNSTLCRWLDRERTSLVDGTLFPELLTVGDRIYYDTHVRPLLHLDGEVREIAVELRRPGGDRLPALISSIRRASDGGSMLTETAVFDTRDRRAYERELLLQRQLAERSQARLQLLYDVASGMTSATTTAEVLAVIVERGAYHEAGAGCSAWLFEGEGGAVLAGMPEDHSTDLPDRLEWESTGSALGELERGELLVVEDIDDPEVAERYPFTHKWLADVGRRSAIIAPLLVDGSLVGVLSYGFVDPHRFDPDERRDVKSLAFQTTEALRRARLLEAEARALVRSDLRRQISTSLNRAMTTDEVATTLAGKDASAFGADAMAVFLLPGVTSDRLHASGRASDHNAETPSFTIGRHAPAVREAIQSLTPVHRENCDGPSELLTDGAIGDVRALSVLPLVERGEAVGIIVVLSVDARIPTSTRVALSGIAAEASIAIGRARRYETERHIALTLQEAMLPQSTPMVHGWTIDAHYQAGTRELVVGGDLYDATLIGDDLIAFVIADVVGHGLAAASTMGQLRSVSRSLALETRRPSKVIDGLHNTAEITPGADCASVCSVIVDRRGVGSYSAAGHPYPLQVSPDGSARFLTEGRSPVLGIPLSEPATEADLHVQPGATLVLYTDGLVERRDESLSIGLERLLDRVRAVDFASTDPARQIVDLMGRDTELQDDVVVLTATNTRT